MYGLFFAGTMFPTLGWILPFLALSVIGQLVLQGTRRNVFAGAGGSRQARPEDPVTRLEDKLHALRCDQARLHELIRWQERLLERTDQPRER